MNFEDLVYIITVYDIDAAELKRRLLTTSPVKIDVDN